MEMNMVNSTLTSSEKFAVENEVNNFNKTLNASGRTPSQQLGKDDFLKLLITQLSNQDPTSPMEDTQFISQMAQFSSLEQMTNMNESFQRMTAMMNSSQAMGTIGKVVDLDLGGTTHTGVVDAITYGQNPQIRVGNMYYDMKQIQAVYGE